MVLDHNIERASWDERFMAEAFVAASRSSCLKFHTGAVITRDNHSIASGYNGAPPEKESCISRFKRELGELACYKTEAGIAHDVKNSGYCIAIHAEDNALRQTPHWMSNGSTMYSVLHPCIECSQLLVERGISRLVWTLPYVEEEMRKAREVMESRGIEVVHLQITEGRIHELVTRTFSQHSLKMHRK